MSSRTNSHPSARSRLPSDKVKANAAEAQAKKEQKAAAEERARARKDKQNKTQAKATERERRQNQENISLDSRIYNQDDLLQPAPQDTTFSVRDIPTGIRAAPVNLAARVSKIPPTRAMKDNTTPKPITRDANTLKTSARAPTVEQISDLVRRWTETPSVVSQAPQFADRQTSSRVKPYEDPLDQLDFPSSPDNDDQSDSDEYEPENEPENDDYEPDRDDNDNDNFDREESLTPPPVSRKRPRSNSVEAGEYEKARKVSKSTGRPKAGDYAQEVQDVLNTAITHYKVDLLRIDPFPERGLELKWSKANWFAANEECDLKIAHNAELIKMITCRGSQLRGEIKTKVKPLVSSMYGFEVPTNDTIRARNRQLVEELKDGYSFLYKTRAVGDQPNSGLYEHKIIQMAINVCFFKNRLDIGVVFSTKFRPFPCVALILVIAAIECSIDEWATGTRVDIHFSEEGYKNVFEEHLSVFNDFADFCKENGCPQLVLKLLERLHDHGRICAGADPLQKEATRTIAQHAFAAALAEFNERNGNFDDE